MSKWLKVWKPEDIRTAEDFAEYCQQTIGCPWPTLKDKIILGKKINELFARYPQLDYYSLCRIVAWMKSRKMRPARVWMVVEMFRDAWQGGALPELNPADQCDKHLESQIAEALKVEQRPEWRRRLLGSHGDAARREVYGEWLQVGTLTSSSSR